MEKIVSAAVYRSGKKVADIDIVEVSAWTTQPDHLVWIEASDEAALRQIQVQLDLHDQAIQDALKMHRRPKLEVYGKTIFIVLRTAFLIDDHIVLSEIHIFVGQGYIITIRHGASASHGWIHQCVETAPKRLAGGNNSALYLLIDFIVENYLTVIEMLTSEIEALEDNILSTLYEKRIARIHELRLELQRMRLVVAPTAEVCRHLERGNLGNSDPASYSRCQDIADHVSTVLEQIDTLREMLSYAFEASLLMEAARQGKVTRKLAGWAAILAAPTALAGIYGMNFEHMPELSWRYGYPLVVGLITVVCTVLFVRFRRLEWI